MIYKILSKSFLTFILSLIFIGCGAYKNVNMYQKNNLLESDEKNLLKSSLKLSKTLNEHDNTLIGDNYNGYPNNILSKLLKDDILNFSKDINFNIHIIKNPTINAFALPNGNIYIHSGLLAKIENEAQLALLIGHEMSHVIYKHTLKQKENLKDSAVISQIFGIITSPFDAGLISGLLFNSSVSGYSKNHENEADEKGFSQIVNAGYDPIEASKLFDIMLKDIELNKIKEPYFFSTHPKVEERIKNSKAIIEKEYTGIKGIINKEAYQAYVKPILIENIELDLKLKRYESAKYSINILKNMKNTNAYENYFTAELFRLKKEENYYEEALKNYQLSLKGSNKNYKAYKGLGYLYFQKNDKVKAKEAFEKYLSLNSNAEDKGYIMHYITLCKKEGKNEKTN